MVTLRSTDDWQSRQPLEPDASTETDEDKPDPVELREKVMQELARKNYAASYHPNAGSGVFTVYVRPGQRAGGELAAILKRFGYAPLYPTEAYSDDFEFKVKCEPANWHELGEPSYDFIEKHLPYDLLREEE